MTPTFKSQDRYKLANRRFYELSNISVDLKADSKTSYKKSWTGKTFKAILKNVKSVK